MEKNLYKKQGNTEDIIEAILFASKMNELVNLKGDLVTRVSKVKMDAEHFCKMVYDHVKKVIDYNPNVDSPGTQIIPTPQVVHDGRKKEYGGTGKQFDSKGIALYVSGLLTTGGVEHSFSFVSENENEPYHHVYITVADGDKKIVIDPVMKEFNVECKYKKRLDKKS